MPVELPVGPEVIFSVYKTSLVMMMMMMMMMVMVMVMMMIGDEAKTLISSEMRKSQPGLVKAKCLLVMMMI